MSDYTKLVGKFIIFKDEERFYSLDGVLIGSKKINDVVLITGENYEVGIDHENFPGVFEFNFLNDDLHECFFELFVNELWKVEVIETE